MNETLVHQLSGWLAATDIAWLELRGPGVHLRLHNDGSTVVPVPNGADLEFDAAEDLPVQAHSVGHFLHAHPLQAAPLVAPGQAVTAGQPLGLLRIGALLLPVTAPRPGRFVGHAVPHGNAVGYGTVLMRLACQPSAAQPPSTRPR